MPDVFLDLVDGPAPTQLFNRELVPQVVKPRSETGLLTLSPEQV